MATSSKILLSPAQQPIFCLPGISAASADKASKLLQQNHEQHHIFFNRDGFHVRGKMAYVARNSLTANL